MTNTSDLKHITEEKCLEVFHFYWKKGDDKEVVVPFFVLTFEYSVRNMIYLN